MSTSIERDAKVFPAGIGKVTGLRRIGRGLASWLLVPFFLLGRWFEGEAAHLDDQSREPDGLTLILTGIQGRSLLEQQIALGLADAGVAGRMQIVDWTTGNPLRMLQHLRGRHLAADAAEKLAQRVVEYRREHPDAPVQIVGYSGGGYVALLLLELLPPGTRVTQAILLAPSVSPYLDVTPLASRTEQGLTHFCSPFDFLVLGALTAVVGTTDGWHSPSAGLVGFHPEGLELPGEQEIASPEIVDRFREYQYRFRWLGKFHYGGHFGYANRVWASEMLGRLLTAPDDFHD